MIVLERMDHSLTRSAGRRDAEKEILDYLLPKSPAAHQLRPRPADGADERQSDRDTASISQPP